MTVGQKVSISFFSTLLIFAVTILVSQAGVFSQIERTLFSQAKVQEKQEYLTEVSQACEEYVSEIVNAICYDEKSYLQNPYVESYLKIEPSEAETSNRRRATEELFTQFEGLVGIRLIDDKQNIWFSTFYETDLTENEENRKELNYLRYKNYEDVFNYEKILSYSVLSDDLPKDFTPKIILDAARNQIVFCVQFQPGSLSRQFNVIKNGVFVFYFDINDLERSLLESRVLNFGDRLIPVSTIKNINLYGFMVSQNLDNLQDVRNAILHTWNTHKNNDSTRFRMENLFEQRDGSILVMLTVPYVQKYLRISGVYDNSIFSLSHQVIVLIYVCLFISLLLIIFLLLSLKVDYSIVIKKRVKRLQYEIISEYFNEKADVDWAVVARQLETKKSTFSTDIKNSFGKKGKKYSAQIDAILERSWDDIINILKSSNKTSGEVDLMKEIKKMLEDVINNSNLNNKTEIIDVPYDIEDEDGNTIKSVDNSTKTENIDIEKELFNSESEKKDTEIEAYENEAMSQLIQDNENNKKIADLYSEIEEIETIEIVDEEDPGQSEDKQINNVEVLDDIEELDVIEEYFEKESEESKEISEEKKSTIDEIEEIDEADSPEEITDDLESVDELSDFEEIDDITEVDEFDEIEEIDISMDSIPGSNVKKPSKYVESNDTYVSTDSDELPTVENVFAEELCHGREYVSYKTDVSPDIEVIIKVPVFSVKETVNEQVEESVEEPVLEEQIEDSIEESVDDVSELNHENCYSMISFANGGDVSTLFGEKNDTIVEKDGVYSIAQDIEFTDIIQDESFKSLVDSILK